jgi:hypothetical protein
VKRNIIFQVLKDYEKIVQITNEVAKGVKRIIEAKFLEFDATLLT